MFFARVRLGPNRNNVSLLDKSAIFERCMLLCELKIGQRNKIKELRLIKLFEVK